MWLRRRGRRPTRAPRRRSELPTGPHSSQMRVERWHFRDSDGAVHFEPASEEEHFLERSRVFTQGAPRLVGDPDRATPAARDDARGAGARSESHPFCRCRPSILLCLQRLGLSRSPTLSRQATPCSLLSCLHSRSFIRAYPSTSSAWPPLLRGCRWGSGFNSFGGVGARNLRRRWLPRIASGSVIRRRNP